MSTIERRDNFYVLTGASGSGKSSIIATLKTRGHICVDEVGRQIVQQQIRIGGDGTPWQDHIKLRGLILAGSIHAFESIDERAVPKLALDARVAFILERSIGRGLTNGWVRLVAMKTAVPRLLRLAP